MKKNDAAAQEEQVRAMMDGDFKGVAKATERHRAERWKKNDAAAQEEQVKIMMEGDFDGVAKARERYRVERGKTKGTASSRGAGGF